MPTPIGHTFLGLATIAIASKRGEKPLIMGNLKLSAFCVIMAGLPDIDFIQWDGAGIIITGLYHHGITHSIGFALMVSALAALVAKLVKRGDWLWFGGLTLALVMSHVIADIFMIDGYPQNGVGIPLLWPISDAYYIVPLIPGMDRSNIFSMASVLGLLLEIFIFGGIFVGVYIARNKM